MPKKNRLHRDNKSKRKSKKEKDDLEDLIFLAPNYMALYIAIKKEVSVSSALKMMGVNNVMLPEDVEQLKNLDKFEFEIEEI